MTIDKRLLTERKKIDAIDAEIAQLIGKRVQSVKKIGEIKKSGSHAIYRPERESQIFRRMLNLNKNSGFPDKVFLLIFREIISACRSVESPLTVAYLGPDTTFTSKAAVMQFGRSSVFKPYSTIADVFSEVGSENVNFGVVPIENSTEGIVNHTLDLLMDHDLYIISEIFLSIHQNLMSRETKLENIKKVASHIQCFGQCRNWLRNYLPNAKLIEFSSTSEAAGYVKNRKGMAAIASKEAAGKYGLTIIHKHIEDNPDNHTRFAVLSKNQKPARSGNDKTSILFTVPHKPGSLHAVLDSISKYKLNMSKIVSRPSKQKSFEYSFFIDLEGHIDDTPVHNCIDLIRAKTLALKILGSYPRGMMNR